VALTLRSASHGAASDVFGLVVHRHRSAGGTREGVVESSGVSILMPTEEHLKASNNNNSIIR